MKSIFENYMEKTYKKIITQQEYEKLSLQEVK